MVGDRFEPVDEAKEAERKASLIALRNQRRKSTIFMLCASVLQIIVTLVVIIALFVAAILLFKVFNIGIDSMSTFFSLMMVVVFGGGMVLGFKIYKNIIRRVIASNELYKVLRKDDTIHYFTEEELAQLENGTWTPKKKSKKVKPAKEPAPAATESASSDVAESESTEESTEGDE